MSRLRKIERHISTPHHPVSNGAVESDREERYNTHVTNVDNNDKDTHGKKNREQHNSKQSEGGSDDATR